MDKIKKLPEDFLSQMKNLLGEKFSDYEKALTNSPERGLRINLKRLSVDEFLKQTFLSLEKLDYASDGFLLKTDEKLGLSFEHLSGQFYLQEPSSMIPVCASQIEKESQPLKILDLCASPGGKTGQIAMRVSDDSLIVSNEVVKDRAMVLNQNIQRQGLKNVLILNEQPERLLCFENYFDYVFVDAPCSGEGMFRKNPETIDEWSRDVVNLCSERQKQILTVATKLVKLGGKLIYSTCTFSEEEDEDVVKFVLENFDFDLVDVPNSIKKVTSACPKLNSDFARKFFPHTGKGEGQFVAVLKRRESEFKTNLYSKKHFKSVFNIGQSYNKIIQQFFLENLVSGFSWKNLYSVAESIYFSNVIDPKLQTALDELRFVSLGVKLGEILKGRFEPNHNFFMAFDNLFKTKIDLSDFEAKKYLHGEELEYVGNAKGFCVVTKNGFPLGGAKITGNKLKNLYPKGLRI